MTTLVVGLGSIGSRHRQVLAKLGHMPKTVSRRPGIGDYGTIRDACESLQITYVVIASETSNHQAAMTELAETGYRGPVLVEKPIGFVDASLVDKFQAVWVGYNLRFHPCVVELRKRLVEETVFSVQARVAQAVGDWRVGRDAADTASNGPAGGALRDLSHELDILEWLFGPSVEVAALGGRLANLGLDVDDTWSCLLRYQRCPQATLELNYLDRMPARFMYVSTDKTTYVCDLTQGHLTVNGKVLFSATNGIDASYEHMHESLLTGAAETACTSDEGFKTMRVIAAIEQAAADRTWAQVL